MTHETFLYQNIRTESDNSTKTKSNPPFSLNHILIKKITKLCNKYKRFVVNHI
jgi:hypothetical protein